MEAVQYNASYTMMSLTALSRDIIQMPKPVYIHCHVSLMYIYIHFIFIYMVDLIVFFQCYSQAGYAASLFAIMHGYLAATVSGDDIFSNGLTLGWDFQADASAVQLINSVTGTNTAVAPPSIDNTLADGEESYKQYFWSHRITDDWYNIGQVLDTQVPSITTAGYKTVISFRNDGEATLRLASDPTEGSVDNNEFSDVNGNYAVDMERSAFEKAGLDFFNLPVTGESAWTIEQLDEFTATMDAAPKPILAHCASGYRSSAYVIAYLGRQQKQCTHWALKEARRIGYSFDQSEDDAQVVAFFQEALQC
jgi:protein tyrosine phosphatase (PTP) superfamily phosphohydrolase (DUF442 family)